MLSFSALSALPTPQLRASAPISRHSTPCRVIVRPRRPVSVAASPASAPLGPSRRSVLALPALSGALLLLPAAPAAAATRAAFVADLAAKLAAAPLDGRACVRLLFLCAATGGRASAVRSDAALLAAPENADVKAVLAVLSEIKEGLDKERLAGNPVSWADLLAWATQVKRKQEFDGITSMRFPIAEERERVLAAYGNKWPPQPLGAVDDAAAGAAVALPAGGAAAGVAAWRAAFSAMGLRESDLALLGPDVISADEAANVAMMRTDGKLAGALDQLEKVKRELTRTGYEVPYSKAVDNLARVGRTINVKAYAFDSA